MLRISLKLLFKLLDVWVRSRLLSYDAFFRWILIWLGTCTGLKMVMHILIRRNICFTWVTTGISSDCKAALDGAMQYWRLIPFFLAPIPICISQFLPTCTSCVVASMLSNSTFNQSWNMRIFQNHKSTSKIKFKRNRKHYKISTWRLTCS